MIVGADGADDREVLARSAELYGAYRLRRVYYSAFSPIPIERRPAARGTAVGARTGSTVRTGCSASRLHGRGDPGRRCRRHARARLDPKLAWALKHRERFLDRPQPRLPRGSPARAGARRRARGAHPPGPSPRQPALCRPRPPARADAPGRRLSSSPRPPSATARQPCLAQARGATAPAQPPARPCLTSASPTPPTSTAGGKPPQPRRHGRAAARRRLAGRRRAARLVRGTAACRH